MARNVRAFVGIFTLICSLGVCGQLVVNFNPSGTWYSSDVCTSNIIPNLDNPFVQGEMRFSDLSSLPLGRGSIEPDDETAFSNSSDNCIRVNVGHQGLNDPASVADDLAAEADITIISYDDDYTGVFLGLGVDSAMAVVLVTLPPLPPAWREATVLETNDQRNDRVMRKMDMCVVSAAVQLAVLCAEAPQLCAPGGKFRTTYQHLNVLTAPYRLEETDLTSVGRHGQIIRAIDNSCNIIAVSEIQIDVDSVEKDSRKLAEVLIHERLHAKKWPGACFNGVINKRREEDMVIYMAGIVLSQLEEATGIDWNNCVDWTPQEIQR